MGHGSMPQGGAEGKDALYTLKLDPIGCVTSSLRPSFLSNHMTMPYLFRSFPLPRRVSRHDVSVDILVLISEADGTQGQMPG